MEWVSSSIRPYVSQLNLASIWPAVTEMIYESTLIHAHNDFQKDYWSYCVVIFAIFYSNFNLFKSYRQTSVQIGLNYIVIMYCGSQNTTNYKSIFKIWYYMSYLLMMAIILPCVMLHELAIGLLQWSSNHLKKLPTQHFPVSYVIHNLIVKGVKL